MTRKTQLTRWPQLSMLSVLSIYAAQLAAASPTAPDIRVAVLGEERATILSERDLSVVASFPLTRGWVEGVWAAKDGTRLAVLTQVGLLSAKEPANLTIFDLEGLQVLGQHQLSYNLRLSATATDGRSGFLVFKGGKAKKKRPASPPTLVGWCAEAATITGSVPLDALPDSIHLLAETNRLVLGYHGDAAAVPAKRTPGRLEVYDSQSLARQRIIPLPGPVVSVVADNRSVLYALDRGTDRKKPQETLAGHVFVVDPAGDGLVADLEVGVGANLLSWDEQREVFYLVTRPQKAETATASFLMIEDEAVTASIKLGSRPYGVVPAPDRSRYYLLEVKGISVISADLSKVEHRIPLPEQPTTLLFTDPPTRAFVSYLGSSRVSVVDLTERTVLADITTGRTGKKIALATAAALGPTFGAVPYTVPDPKTFGLFSPDGRIAFLINTQTVDITAVDTETFEVLEKFPGSMPSIVLDGTALAALKVKDLVLFDLEQRQALPEMEVGMGASSISPGGRYVWSSLSSKVAVFDLQARRRVKTFAELPGQIIEYVPVPTTEPGEQLPADSTPPPAEPEG